MGIKEQISSLLEELNNGVYEKREVIALALLTAIAGESIFLLGAPGVAKSLIARRLKFAFKDGTSFEYLMNRFSTPDEIFGPISISQLKDHDKYERIIKNYLPNSTVVFLDEIWKAGPSIQNSLLTVLNEKVYRNGDQEIKVPIKAIISASNELPMQGEGLEALWDRFLVRFVVDGISDKDLFNEMISKSINSYEDNISILLKLTDETYDKISLEIDQVEIPENIFNVIHLIRNYINQYNKNENNQGNQIYISDRRWKKIIRLLRTSAFINERNEVDLMDCFLISHCIWNEPSQYEIVSQFTKEAILQNGFNLNFNLEVIKEELDEINLEVKKETIKKRRVFIKVPLTFNRKYYKIRNFAIYSKIPYYNQVDHFILIQDYNDMTNEYHSEKIYYKKNFNSYYDYNSYSIKKGKNENSIVYKGKVINLDSYKKEKIEIITKKPDIKMQLIWDKRIKKTIYEIKAMKKQINQYKKINLIHHKSNLFVHPIYTDTIELSLDLLLREIEKFELEANNILSNYQNIIEDEVLSEEFENIFELFELSEYIDENTLNKLEEINIFTSDDFLKSDHNYLKNTFSDVELNKIKKTIEEKLKNDQSIQ